jgi:hypothetical protein
LRPQILPWIGDFTSKLRLAAFVQRYIGFRQNLPQQRFALEPVSSKSFQQFRLIDFILARHDNQPFLSRHFY